MKRIAMFLLSICLAFPTWLAAQSDQPAPQQLTTPSDQPPPSAPSVQPAPADSSSSYQQAPLDSGSQSLPSSPSVSSGRFDRNHGEAGIFADYLRFTPASSTTNFVGVGGRVGFNVHPNLGLEAEMNYDFARNFTTSTNNGVTTTFVTTGVRPLTGLFGPKLQFGTSGPFRAFVTGKVGFIDFSTNTSGTVSGSTFSGAVAGVGGSGTHFAAYPGGGVEMFAGWLGLRLEAGDEIYLNNGTFNNLRVTAGPTIRF